MTTTSAVFDNNTAAWLASRNHPQRDLLEKELQQRFFPALTAPCTICHFMLTLNAGSRAAEFALMQQRALTAGVQLREGDTDVNLQLGDSMLRWERHSEFTRYVLVQPLPAHAGAGAQEPELLSSLVLEHAWMQAIPGRTVAAIKMVMLQAELPGVAKEDIHVDVHGKLVTLKAEIRQHDSQNKEDRALRSERYYGSVSRTVELPVEVAPDKVSARFDNGILTLQLPKQAVTPAPHRVPIE